MVINNYVHKTGTNLTNLQSPLTRFLPTKMVMRWLRQLKLFCLIIGYWNGGSNSLHFELYPKIYSGSASCMIDDHALEELMFFYMVQVNLVVCDLLSYRICIQV